MRDVHCHIIPGVDDGSPDLETSKHMLVAARNMGIDEIVCTPHCRWDGFSISDCQNAFELLRPWAESAGITMTLSYEVYYKKLMELGIEHAPKLCNPKTKEFLLELSTRGKPIDLDRTIFTLQGMGLTVIIAHPERYPFVQQDLDLVYEWKSAGCLIQLSANFAEGGMFDKRKKAARAILKEGWADFIASDAHRPGHYQTYKQCLAKYSL